MTKANTTSANGSTTTITQPLITKPLITKQQRRLKIQKGYYKYQDYQEHGTQSSISELLLKGKWLNDAGFTADSLVTIQVKRGKLVITAEQ